MDRTNSSGIDHESLELRLRQEQPHVECHGKAQLTPSTLEPQLLSYA